jgi:glycine cleavage system H protein
MTLKYTPDHEWLQIQADGTAVVGITQHAQDALGDVVFVDLPAVGATFVTGEIIEVNEALRDDPALANSDPMGAGWFFKVKLAKPEELDALMDATAYDDLLKNA